MTTRASADRQRLLRTLTRFQRVAGFDRAIALASSALTTLIPLAVFVGAVLPHADGETAANAIIARYGLTGGGAAAVRNALAPAAGTGADVSILGVFLVMLATLSFARGAQRLFEQTWGLSPLSVRNSFNELVWVIGLTCYIAFSWWVRGLVDVGHVEIVANVVLIPVSAVFLAWTGRMLSARRLEWRALAPFGILGSALLAIGFILGSVYVPHLFSVYASRYGAIGAVMAMISWLFAVMLIVVVSVAIGREVAEELGRIRRGERPPEDEVRREWNVAVDQARSRWQAWRDWVGRFGRR